MLWQLRESPSQWCSSWLTSYELFRYLDSELDFLSQIIRLEDVDRLLEEEIKNILSILRAMDTSSQEELPGSVSQQEFYEASECVIVAEVPPRKEVAEDADNECQIIKEVVRSGQVVAKR